MTIQVTAARRTLKALLFVGVVAALWMAGLTRSAEAGTPCGTPRGLLRTYHQTVSLDMIVLHSLAPTLSGNWSIRFNEQCRFTLIHNGSVTDSGRFQTLPAATSELGTVVFSRDRCSAKSSYRFFLVKKSVTFSLSPPYYAGRCNQRAVIGLGRWLTP